MSDPFGKLTTFFGEAYHWTAVYIEEQKISMSIEKRFRSVIDHSFNPIKK